MVKPFIGPKCVDGRSCCQGEIREAMFGEVLSTIVSGEVSSVKVTSYYEVMLLAGLEKVGDLGSLPING
jgi:hypothetical protein